MPVITRNQSRNNMTSVPPKNITSVPPKNITSVPPKNITSVPPKNITSVSPKNNITSASPKYNITSWFIAIIKKGLNDIDDYDNEKDHLYSLKFYNKVRHVCYNKLRRLTEMMYIIEQYFPLVDLEAPYPSFAKLVYKKIQMFYTDISKTNMYKKPKTKEEKKILIALITTLQNVEKMIINYIPEDTHESDFEYELDSDSDSIY